MSISTFVATVVLVVGPWFYFFRSSFRPQSTKLRPAISTILLLHTLFILYYIIVLPPPNLFKQLQLPIAVPTDTIRNIVKAHANGRPLSATMEQMLTRMGSFETRTLYIRFGHDAVTACEHCHDFWDFALYTLPSLLGTYVREAVLIGLVTIRGTGKERWRTLSVGLLVLGIVAECYWITTVNISIPQSTRISESRIIMWHDNLFFARNFVFLILPLTVHYILATTPPPSREASLNPTELNTLSPTSFQQYATLQGLLGKIQLLKYTRGTISRVPELSTRAQEYWNRDKKEGDWVRDDPNVRQVATKVGLGFEESDPEDETQPKGPPRPYGDGEPKTRLRANAKIASSALMKALQPSQFWEQTPPARAPPSSPTPPASSSS